MVQATSIFSTIIKSVECELANFYRFDLLTTAADHLVDKSDIEMGFKTATHNSEFSARGSVWLCAENREEVFIGLHIHDDLRATLTDHDPLIRLSDQNLDAFCILVEELSHFHLLLNRLQSNRGVSKLELEWQGEIDKVLMSALLLDAQNGDPHIYALTHKLYDLAQIISPDLERYDEATRFAAKFWFQAAKTGTHPQRLKPALQQKYRAPWTEKLEIIDQRPWDKAG